MARRFTEFRQKGKNQSAGERGDRIQRDGDAQEFTGLCANCAKRLDCLLPKREGGVWHCEEYVEEQ